MCGICGIINFNQQPVNTKDLHTMMNAMKYRGPDDEGIYKNQNIGLGFVRLSILDLSPAGNQPMYSADKRFIIVFNGEIFNYLELKKILDLKYRFSTETDTEVVLAAFIEWGSDCVHKFNGMWAFAIYDSILNNIFISRDRFGIKPFFYYHDDERFIFASDIPPILKILNNKPGPDNQSIYDYLVFNRTNYSGRTFFENIKKLPHAHNIDIPGRDIKISKWYDLKTKLIDGFKSVEEFRQMLEISIDQQLRSDVPVGACLSGGLDSSSIVSLILKNNTPDFNTFSAIYEAGALGDESDYIKEYNDPKLKKHFTNPTASSLLSDMDSFIEALVEPVPNTSEYAEYKVMELAKKHCTVILNGQGADEEMAGYLIFFGVFFKELLIRRQFKDLLKEISAYRKVHRNNIGLHSFIFHVLPPFLKEFKTYANYDYLSKEFLTSHKSSDELTRKLYNSRNLKESLLNHFEYKFEHHLSWADRSGMWFSLETRFPFLDHRFVEKVLALPTEQIIGDGITKKILRASMQDILPEKIRMRMDKVGYETPENDWFRTPAFQQKINEIINSPSFIQRGYFNHKKVVGLYQHHISGKKNIGKEIWKWIHLELWFQKFID